MTTNPDSTPQAPQHLLDFARLWTAIRRGRRLWIGFALVGFLAGGLLAVLLPPTPSAVTRILVTHEQDGPSDGGSLIRTDVALMSTTRIAADALERLKVTERPEEFLKTITVTGLTNNVLEVTVEAPTGAEAARRAKALAEAFIADHVGRIQSAAAAEAKALTDQRGQVQAELDEVNGQISGAEAAAAASQDNENGENGEEAAPPPANAATLDTLYARRAELTDQISQLTQQAQEAGLGAPRVVAGTQVVDAPRPVRTSLKLTGATNAGIGLVFGLVLGVALAAVTGVVRDKPVLRRDIAEHLGASVIAQLPGGRRGPLRNRKAGQEHARVAETLLRLVRDGAGPVSALELGAPKVAASLAAAVDAELADGEAGLRTGSVAPGASWTGLPHLGAETLLVVRAGYASTAWLHTVARQLADLGIPVVGIVLVDPDPRDRTDGTLWDGLHTALRGRAKHAARTTNGTNGSNGSNGADLPTKRLAPATASGTSGTSVHDLPTKKFAPVRRTPG
ncbi:Wzz/FepE/Etk N-terminal domain-containing protein [Actinophytocola glycyrrhizae]|uniref:Wzz/FepE/Etk N-terminal domain-containing protein n=1 Tax=Actinophytocola glycyrrhizae TaxID=2044873 RepID=A0ABV9SBG0_9PSEU